MAAVIKTSISPTSRYLFNIWKRGKNSNGIYHLNISYMESRFGLMKQQTMVGKHEQDIDIPRAAVADAQTRITTKDSPRHLIILRSPEYFTRAKEHGPWTLKYSSASIFPNDPTAFAFRRPRNILIRINCRIMPIY